MFQGQLKISHSSNIDIIFGMHMHLIGPYMFRSDMSRSSFKVNFNMSQVPVETDPSRSQLSQKNPSINAIWHLVCDVFRAIRNSKCFFVFLIFHQIELNIEIDVIYCILDDGLCVITGYLGYSQ